MNRWKLLACSLALTTAAAGWAALRPRPPAQTLVVERPGPLRAARVARPDEEARILQALAGADGTAAILALVERLGAVGGERSIETLALLAEDRRPGVAEAALAALGRIGGGDASELLVAHLDDRRLRIRLAAVSGL